MKSSGEVMGVSVHTQALQEGEWEDKPRPGTEPRGVRGSVVSPVQANVGPCKDGEVLGRGMGKAHPLPAPDLELMGSRTWAMEAQHSTSVGWRGAGLSLAA